MEWEARTGELVSRAEMLPSSTERELNYRRWLMWRDLVGSVVLSIRDGRVYCVSCSRAESEVEREHDRYYLLEFSVLLCLRYAKDAKVGEWVWELPVQVPDDVTEWRAPWGAVFERGPHGWKRIE